MASPPGCCGPPPGCGALLESREMVGGSAGRETRGRSNSENGRKIPESRSFSAVSCEDVTAGAARARALCAGDAGAVACGCCLPGTVPSWGENSEMYARIHTVECFVCLQLGSLDSDLKQM